MITQEKKCKFVYFSQTCTSFYFFQKNYTQIFFNVLLCDHKINTQLNFANTKHIYCGPNYATEKEKSMNNSIFEGIDEIFKGIEERLDLLPELHRDVIEMSFGLDGGSPMNIKDIAWQLREEYIDLEPKVVEAIQKEGLRMLRDLSKKDEWIVGNEAKDYDPAGFTHLFWKRLDSMLIGIRNSGDMINELRERLRTGFHGTDYIVLPSLRDLYEYDGDPIGFPNDAVKPTVAEFENLKEDMCTAANLLEAMGKTLLPNRKLNGNCGPTILDYSYLGMDMAEKIVLFNTRFTNVSSPVRTIKGMFDATGEDGELTIPGWFEPTEKDEADYNFKAVMDWDEKDLDEVLEDFSDYYLSLLELAERMKENYDPNKLDKNLASLFETLYLREEMGNTYFDGDSPAIDMIINRSNRFIKLVQMGAPLIVQWGEAAYLAQAYAIYKCGKSLEKVSKPAV